MLKTKYSGQIEMIGTGRLVSDWFTRRATIKIGDQKIRNVMASDDLDDFVENSLENQTNVTLNVGWVMFFRWLLSAKTPSDTIRQGAFLFVAGMIAHVFIVGIAGLIVGAVAQELLPHFLGTVIGFTALGLGLATAILNFKAWLVA